MDVIGNGIFYALTDVVVEITCSALMHGYKSATANVPSGASSTETKVVLAGSYFSVDPYEPANSCCLAAIIKGTYKLTTKKEWFDGLTTMEKDIFLDQNIDPMFITKEVTILKIT